MFRSHTLMQISQSLKTIRKNTLNITIQRDPAHITSVDRIQSKVFVSINNPISQVDDKILKNSSLFKDSLIKAGKFRNLENQLFEKS
ncbi:hypothetical protein HDU92_002944 [Lobulomyces angularis]|nr:hypothetical protein HDU92_002944 [Lobulomyces angularis]